MNSFISENPIVAKIQYWMKITFVFILILFIDSVNRVYRVQIELIAATENATKGSYVFSLSYLHHLLTLLTPLPSGAVMVFFLISARAGCSGHIA